MRETPNRISSFDYLNRTDLIYVPSKAWSGSSQALLSYFFTRRSFQMRLSPPKYFHGRGAQETGPLL